MENNSSAAVKKALRRTIAERKALHPMQERKALSVKLLEHLAHDPLFLAARTVLLYYALPDEVFTHTFVEAWSSKKRILLPEVVGDDLRLRIYTGAQDMRTGAYGIAEPIGEVFTQYAEIDVAIIPGVSFDDKGNRLGRGKGYYDRLLTKLSSHNIGICFSFQVSSSVPTETFDKPMNRVLTDEGWLLP